MQRINSINGISLEFIQSVLKIDENSPTGLTWLPRNSPQWNGKHANKTAGYKEISKKDGYTCFRVTVTYNEKSFSLLCSRIIFLLHNHYLTDGKTIDHIDGNSLNNKISNLREVTILENSYNRKQPSNNTSGDSGVSWCEASKSWMVRIGYKKERKYFGCFKDKNDAIKFNLETRKKLYGKFNRD